MWLAKAFHCFPKEFHRCLAVAALRDIAFQHFAFVIYGALQVVRFTVDLHKHLIQMPLPIRMSTKLLTPFLSDFSCKQWAEPVPPEANRLMADIDPAFVQQIFDVPERERITHIHHHRQANDFWRRLEVAKG
jgi:hypothetical protein